MVLALGSDFTTPSGTLAAIDPSTLHVTQHVATPGSDAMIRVRDDGNRVYVVNRAGADSHDNIQVLDASKLLDGMGDSLVYEVSTGPMTNPQDLAVGPCDLYVPLYGLAMPGATGSGTVAELDYATGSPQGAVDFTATTYDPDKNPQLHSVAYKNGLIWVAMQLFDVNYTPERNGVVVGFDPTSGAVKATLDLTTKDPFTLLVDDPSTDDLLVGTAPDVVNNPTQGCVEAIDTKARTAKGCVVQNTALGGYVDHFQVEASGLWALAVSPTDTTGQLETWDPTKPTQAPKVLSTSSEIVTDCLALPDGTIFASDTEGAAPGVRVWDPTGVEKTASAPLNIGLSPQFVDGLAYVP
jgi:hypothetical protein